MVKVSQYTSEIIITEIILFCHLHFMFMFTHLQILTMIGFENKINQVGLLELNLSLR